MKLLAFLLFSLFLSSVLSLRVLKKDDVPKDYSIGRVLQMSFTGDGRIFFQCKDQVFGFMDGKTGKISTLFLLDSDEVVIQMRGHDEIVIGKGKQINIFLPLEEKYVRLQQSDYLVKQQFTKIISFKRYYMYNYILTDQFLVQFHNHMASRQNPWTNKKVEEQKVLAKKQKSQEFFQIIFLGAQNPENVGIGLVSFKDGKKQICLRKYYVNGESTDIVCYTLDPSEKFSNIVEMGVHILIVYEKKKVILDLNMKKLKEAQQKQLVTYMKELNIVGDKSNSNNLKNDQEGKTMMFFDMGNPDGSNHVQVYKKYMMVKRQDKVIANIPKNEKDEVRNIWAHSYEQGNKGFLMIVQYEDGKIQAYKVDDQKKTHKLAWELASKDSKEQIEAVKKIKGGQTKQAEKVTIKEEEEIIEEGNTSGEKEALKDAELEIKRAEEQEKRVKEAEEKEKNKPKEEDPVPESPPEDATQTPQEQPKPEEEITPENTPQFTGTDKNIPKEAPKDIADQPPIEKEEKKQVEEQKDIGEEKKEEKEQKDIGEQKKEDAPGK